MDVPKTLDEAVQWIVDSIQLRDRTEIKALLTHKSAEDVAGMSHHGFGTYVRNELQLWHPPSEDLRQQIWDSLDPEKQKFYRDWWVGKGDHQGRTMHADDASHTLLTAAVKKIGEGA